MNQVLYDELLESFKKLSPDQKVKVEREVSSLEKLLAQRKAERAKNDPWYFLTELVWTMDEHNKENPVQRFPRKEYLRDLSDLFQTEPLLLVEKSRQMMVTWTFVACCLWDALFHPGRRIFFQSKKEADAAHLVDRARFIYDHLPEGVKELYPVNPPAYCKLEFGKWNSIIQGIPQGAHVLRQFTASRIFSDEMGFQEEAESAFVAARPTITGGGSFVGVSSPNGKGFFYLLAKDKV